MNSYPANAVESLVFRCDRVFIKPTLQIQIEDWGVQIDQVEITGHKDYPLNEVLSNLKLSPQWIRQAALEQKQVLSLAEGTGGVISYLTSQGVRVSATDLWYQQRLPEIPRLDELKQFQQKWGAKIFPSDVRELPLASDSVDVVLSHKLYNNLHLGDTLRSISEALRVLRVRGEARLADVSPLAFHHIDLFLQKNFQGMIEYTYEDQFLRIKKLKSLPRVEIQSPYDSRFRYPGIPNGTKTFELPWATQ